MQESNEDKWSLGDLVSNYSRGISERRLADPTGKKFKYKYRNQRAFCFYPIIGPDIQIGRPGVKVINCKENCSFPELRVLPSYPLIILNQWNGVWYYAVINDSDEGSYYLFGKADGNRWVRISKDEFPHQIAITNMNYELDAEHSLSRDTTREVFSQSSPWRDHKSLWYFLKYGKEYEYRSDLPDPFPDTEAFPFFLKYIKPHWKFDNPVLDMDFSPYEGLDPGKIPLPSEIAKPVGK